MQHIIDKNQEILNSYLRAIEEMSILRENLIKKEVSIHTTWVGWRYIEGLVDVNVTFWGMLVHLGCNPN